MGICIFLDSTITNFKADTNSFSDNEVVTGNVFVLHKIQQTTLGRICTGSVPKSAVPEFWPGVVCCQS